jgi:fermentation-respiration switch protein FrsA (DUF1100 family)
VSNGWQVGVDVGGSKLLLVATEEGRRAEHRGRTGPAVSPSIEMLIEYEPGAYIDRISPTPLLMAVAAQDHLTVADEAFAAYQRALEPKKLVILPGGHFDAYVKAFDLASAAARDWFTAYLKP